VSASTGVFTSSITASAFYGDGSHLTGVSGGTDFATSTTVYSGFNTFIGTVQVNSIQLRPNSGQTLCELDAWNNAGQLAGQVQVDGTLTWYAAAAFPVAGNFYNASVNAGQFYYSNPAGNGQLISYNLFGGTQTFTGQNTFSGTQGISLSSYILSTSTRSVTPTQAGVLAINERYELLIATGTAKGAWMKVGSQ
jgi:hypothetical protein